MNYKVNMGIRMIYDDLDSSKGSVQLNIPN